MRTFLYILTLTTLFITSIYFSLSDGEQVDDKEKTEKIQRSKELNDFRDKAKRMMLKLERK